MPRRVVGSLSVLIVVGCAFTTSCVALAPGVIAAGVVARRAHTPDPLVTIDSLRAGDSIRVRVAPGARGAGVPARFDSLRGPVLHFSRAGAAGADTVSAARLAGIDVRRGTRKSPSRAFWGPVVGALTGFGIVVLPACSGPDAGSLCGLTALVAGAIPGAAIGAWWGLRAVPRWVRVTRTP